MWKQDKISVEQKGIFQSLKARVAHLYQIQSGYINESPP